MHYNQRIYSYKATQSKSQNPAGYPLQSLTTDNYNTEMFERLHIDFAKEGWHASNQRDEFSQMICWLSHQGKVFSFNRYVAKAQLSTSMPLSSSGSRKPPISIAKYPNHPNKLILLIESTHKAPGLIKYLEEFLNTFFTDNQTSNH